MAGTASDPFFWNDWRGDPLLRMCSLAARGAWIEMLAIAAEAKPKGHVLLNGKRPTMGELAFAMATDVDTLTAAVSELEKWGVCSTTRHGVYYSRRVVRDVKKRLASSKGGKIGGRVTYEGGKGIFATQGVAQEATQGGTQHPLPLPSPFKKKVSKKVGSSPGDDCVVFPEWFPLDSWQGYLAMRRTNRWPVTPYVAKLLISKLTAYRDQGHDPAAVLDHATVCAYRSVWPVPAGDRGDGMPFKSKIITLKEIDGEP